MTLKVLSLITTFSLFSISSCHDSLEAHMARTTWIFPYPRAAFGTRIGRQVPPHHEPDAVLINVGAEGGHPGIPAGGVPGFPLPGGPGIFGGPGVFGVPGGGATSPGVFGFPGFPNGFGFPGNSGNPRGPNVYFPHGQNLPNGPGVFFHHRQGNPAGPNGPGVFFPQGPGSPEGSNGPTVFYPQGQDNPVGPHGPGLQFGQNGPGFVVRSGVFGVPNGPSRSEPTRFGLPGIFTRNITAGYGNNPMPGVPVFFVPGRGPNLPEAPNNLPGDPGSFVPGGTNGFRPGGMFPGAFFPDAPFIPNRPEGPGSFGGNFPGKESNGGTGGREMYDDSEASLFPLGKKSLSLSNVPS